MKLLIIISVIAYSYAEKLDNTYLPPENAGTAGGSPGSLTAPGSQTGSGLSNVPSSFGRPSGSTFGQPSGPTFGQGTSQVAPQSGSTQPGQIAVGQYTPQQYGQSGALPQSGRPGFDQGSVGFIQVGTSPGAGSPGIGQGSPGFNQAGTLAGSNRPVFGQASSGYNQAPAFGAQAPTFGAQAQVPSAYVGQVQPERARASIDRNAEILRYDNQNNGDSYSYSFETSNGISAEESGVATNGVRAKGSFAYTGDDGQQYRVTYTADENGYLPQGDHLPTPPPIPAEILKSLEDNARAAAAGTQEGAYNPNEDFGAGVVPQQFGGIYTSQGQPGQTGVAYRPGQGSVGTGQQGFQNQGPVTQYGSSRYPNAQGSIGYPGAQGGQSLSPQNGVTISSPGYQGNQAPTSQYNVAGVSLSGIATSSRPDFSSQSSNTDASRYGSSIGSPSSSLMTQQQGLNSNSGYQYNAPGSLSGSGQVRPQGSQVSIGQNPTGQYNRPSVEGTSTQGRPSTISQYGTPSGFNGSYRPGSQTPVGAAGTISRPNQFAATYGGPNTQIASSSRPNFVAQGNQNSGYNYNAPTGSSSVRPLGTGPLNRPQGFSPQTQSPQNIQGTQGTQTLQQQGGQSPSPQYSGPASSPSSSVRPSGSQSYPTQGTQASQYGNPSLTASGLDNSNKQTQSGLNQRPQLGISGPTGAESQKPSNQRQDDGYQYDRPQSQFSTSQTGPGVIRPSGPSASPNNFNQFNRPSLDVTSSTPTQGTTAFSGNNYAPSGPLSAGPTTAPNVFGSAKPSVSINQGYPSGPVSSGSTGSAPVVIGQGSNIPKPGQYPSTSPTAGPTGSAFSRPDISAGAYEPTSQYQSGQNSGASSPSVGSGYQYDRPGSQGPSSGSAQTPFGSQPGIGSISSGQDNSGRVGTQTGFGLKPSSQDRPGQTGSQSGPGFGPSGPEQTSSQPGYRPSGQDRPTENFGGPRQPPSFSAEEGYKY